LDRALAYEGDEPRCVGDRRGVSLLAERDAPRIPADVDGLSELPRLQREHLDQPGARVRQVRLTIIRCHADAEYAALQRDAVRELCRGEVELVEIAVLLAARTWLLGGEILATGQPECGGALIAGQGPHTTT